MALQKKNNRRVHPQVDSSTRPDLLSSLENHLIQHYKVYAALLAAVALLCSLLLFNARITDANDDSAYIEAAYSYATNPGKMQSANANAPLYPMVLSIPIALFGFNLIVLKLLSVFFFVTSVLLLVLSFRNRISMTILLPATLLTGINSLFLFYASQTYTEALALLCLVATLWLAIKLDEATHTGLNLRHSWVWLLLLGLSLLLGQLTRNVFLAVVPAVLLYLLLYRKYLPAVLTAVSFGLWTMLWRLVNRAVWGANHDQFSNQGKIMLQKDAYNPGLGQETLSGFAMRFVGNAKVYGSQFFELIGLKEVGTPFTYVYPATLVALFALSLYFAFRHKQRYIVLIAVVTAALLAASFISLHTSWAQARLVMLFIPFILIVVFYAIISLLRSTAITRKLQWLYLVLVGVLVLINLQQVSSKANANLPILRKNLAGNPYAGFTPDWVNYLKMSNWAATNTDTTKRIACRKAPMSFVYSKGHSFVPIYSVPTIAPAELLAEEHFSGNLLALKQGVVAAEMDYTLKPYLIGMVVQQKEAYLAYNMDQAALHMYKQALQHQLIPYITHADTLLHIIEKNAQPVYAVHIDKLLGSLHERNVGYVIDASLRLNPKQKTGDVITTVRRYLYFIDYKYPGALTLVHQIGNDEQEPAMLYKLVYPQQFIEE